MSAFKLDSPFSPTGDQPEAIRQLVEGVNEGSEHQVLLGVTGSGKTFTMEGYEYTRASGGHGPQVGFDTPPERLGVVPRTS